MAALVVYGARRVRDWERASPALEWKHATQGMGNGCAVAKRTMDAYCRRSAESVCGFSPNPWGKVAARSVSHSLAAVSSASSGRPAWVNNARSARRD